MLQHSYFFKALDNFINRSTPNTYLFTYLFHSQCRFLLDNLNDFGLNVGKFILDIS